MDTGNTDLIAFSDRRQGFFRQDHMGDKRAFRASLNVFILFELALFEKGEFFIRDINGVGGVFRGQNVIAELVVVGF